MKEIVDILSKNNETIATMESCTGGYIVNEITNIEGASNVISFSAVTYSNEYKIKMGVPREVIDKYTVYSIETAIEMAKAIADFSDSTYGIGITGKLNKQDLNNLSGAIKTVYICIYDRKRNRKQTITLDADDTRVKSKQKICYVIEMVLKDFIDNSK